MNRREFLISGGTLAAGMHLAPKAMAAAPYRVGVGKDSSAYVATQRAIQASAEWSTLNLAGATVIIKPNLVWPAPANSGITVDPEVVRAVVDLCLAGNAARIVMAETSVFGANWSYCGYDSFRTYDPQNRIELVDPALETPVLTNVPGALSWPMLFVPPVYLTPNSIFINIAKMKVHTETIVSLATKNLFGMPATDKYPSPGNTGSWAPRLGLHDRGVHPSIVDVNRIRPVNFHVLDGMWGMEGFGPVVGTAVKMDTVLAGVNGVAVDRVALYLMGLPQYGVPHLTMASRLGMGPNGLADIDVSGDSVTPRTFYVPPLMPPLADVPVASPISFKPQLGQSTSIRFWYSEAVTRRITVLRVYNDSVNYDVIKTLRPNAAQAAGYELVTWDGRAEDGTFAPWGRYALHVRAVANRPEIYHANATGWAFVLP